MPDVGLLERLEEVVLKEVLVVERRQQLSVGGDVGLRRRQPAQDEQQVLLPTDQPV
jgi:hypothetical protein